MLRPLENLLTTILLTLGGWVGNIGLGVVLMTVLIRIVLHPLSRWSLRSMKRMQALAPQIEVLRRKYKENPQQLNIEMMNLYRSSGANPFGGCLPLLVQMPVIYALFGVLRHKERFAGATLLGIPLDISPTLSAITQNPVLAVIPILVGVTTYLQQRMSITDPQQARIFIFMPIMVAWFSLNFPVGLSVYWIVSTVVAIFEYLLVVGKPVRPAPALVKEGTERARRREKPGKRA
jgi:YidC/Oxa1 family membrane protein insertase